MRYGKKHVHAKRWHYDHHDDASPPPSLSEDIVSHMSQLISTDEVVPLSLPVKVALADDQTRGDFMMELHSFYLEMRARMPATATVRTSPQLQSRPIA